MVKPPDIQTVFKGCGWSGYTLSKSYKSTLQYLCAPRWKEKPAFLLEVFCSYALKSIFQTNVFNKFELSSSYQVWAKIWVSKLTFLASRFSKKNASHRTQEISTIILLFCFYFTAYCSFILCPTLKIMDLILTAASLFYPIYVSHLCLVLTLPSVNLSSPGSFSS